MTKIILALSLMVSLVAAPALLISPASAGYTCTSNTYYGTTYTTCR